MATCSLVQTCVELKGFYCLLVALISKNLVKMVYLIIPAIFVFSLFSAGNAFEIQQRIVRGFNAELGEFPYFVELQTQPFKKFNWLEYKKCGATIISDEWILTAAQCIFAAKYVTAYLGVSRKGNSFEVGNVERFVRYDDFHLHPNFNQSTLSNDIGLFPKFGIQIEYLQRKKIC